VVRHPLVQRIVNAYERHDENGAGGTGSDAKPQ
jgi:phosphate starvation-inducible protein PhoH